MAQYRVRPWWNTPGKGLLIVLLATLLAGCTSSEMGSTRYIPKGTLSVLAVPTPYVLPGQIVRGSDGNLWFPAIAYQHFATNQPSGAIGNLSPSGQFHLFPLPDLNSYPTAMTFGSDGSIWFAAVQGNGTLAFNRDGPASFTGGFSEIGHMTQQGQFQFFPLPSPNINVTSIAAGSDSNLWFTEYLTVPGPIHPQISRMTPAGVFSDFPVIAPFADGFLHQIITGPDGNLWFSLEGGDANNNAVGALGRVTTQGAISIVSLGKFAVPVDMTVGPDHNLWFTTTFGVGRVTPNEQVRLFVPKVSAGDYLYPGGITTGPDGALWFATANVEVGRVTTNGAFSFYPLPYAAYFDNGSSSTTAGDLKGIVLGADGTFWLTNDANIGHFV